MSENSRVRSQAKGSTLDMGILKRLIRFIVSSYKKEYAIIIVCLIISALATVSSSLFMRILIDTYITPLLQAVNPDYGPLAHALISLSCIFVLGLIANFIYQKLLVTVSQGTMEKLRKTLFSTMEKLPIRYFDTHAHGDIMSIYTNDIDTLRQVISQSIPQFLNSMFMVVAVFIAMLVISIPLTLITAVMVLVMQYVTRLIMAKSGKYFVLQQDDLGIENGYIEEMMEGAKVVKVFNYETEVISEFERINEGLFNSSFRANKYANILMPIVANLGNVSYVLCALLGGLASLSGVLSLSIGSLASFLALNRSFNQPLNQISQQLNAVIMAMAGAKRIFALMDEVPETDNGQVTLVNAEYTADGTLTETVRETGMWAWKHPHPEGGFDYVKLDGDVRFHDVSFSYDPGHEVLHDINIYAEPGQKIAFVGATGAGKTTITNLINRFYDIDQGSITYDGIDVKLIKKDDLRHSLAVVLQDTNLFSGTIEENIKYARPKATREEVVEAARCVNADSFIKHLDHGYDTQLSHSGSTLSQGQRQLLSIARAALANPPVLILDEATSSIDSRTEKLVQDGMDKLMEGRTTFVIAHRLSTIKNAHVIMVMDHGKIIERGNHESLMAKRGTYYQLYTGLIEND